MPCNHCGVQRSLHKRHVALWRMAFLGKYIHYVALHGSPPRPQKKLFYFNIYCKSFASNGGLSHATFTHGAWRGKAPCNHQKSVILFFILILCFFVVDCHAQRMAHGACWGGAPCGTKFLFYFTF